MPDFLARVEAINFGSTLFDTEDISTIRGASLTLEIGIARLVREHTRSHEVLYVGGSQAAFVLRGIEDAGARKFAADLRQSLRAAVNFPFGKPEFSDPAPTGHMLFAVEAVPIVGGGVAAALARSQALVRRRQLRAPTVVAPEAYALQDGEHPRDVICRVDSKRPISPDKGAEMFVRTGQFAEAPHDKATDHGETTRVRLSHRSTDLREFGRSARGELYRELLGADAAPLDGFSFSQSFEDIVADPPDGLPISVRGKIGVLYFDGVGFGAIRNDYISRGEPDRFSQAVRDLFQDVVRRLLVTFAESSGSDTQQRYLVTRWDPKVAANRPHLRLETLMLGGEDYCVIVPGWLAWWTARHVLEAVERFASVTADPLKLRCGALICDSRTPIRGARRLADAMCNADDLRSLADNAVQFHVIESVEVPDDALEMQRAKLFGVPDAAPFCFTLNQFQKVEEDVIFLKRALPRSQLYKLIKQLERGREAPHALVEAALERSDRAEVSDPAELMRRLPGPDELKPLFGLKLLAMLWDYVDPFRELAG